MKSKRATMTPNGERQPREAAAAAARMQPGRNGCLPLGARSGWAKSFSINKLPLEE